MSVETIECEIRNEAGRGASKRARAEGKVPGVVYGGKEPNVNVLLSLDSVKTILRMPEMSLDLNAGGTVGHVKVAEIQYDFLGEEVIHLDFLRLTS